MTDQPIEPVTDVGIDIRSPNAARVWNHWLGGSDNNAADRAVGDAWTAVYPDIVPIATAGRAFLARTIRFAADAGVRQFLDIGAGLPSAGNTHQVVQRVAPGARVVYVDHDPVVLHHAGPLLAGTDPAAVRYRDADLYDPAGVLAAAAETLDLRRPVAVLLVGVLGHLPDVDDARDAVRYLMDRTCSGSHLAVADGTHHGDGGALRRSQLASRDLGTIPYLTREPADLGSLLEGLDLVDPGFLPISLWRPDVADPRPLAAFGGVGRKA